MWSIPVAGRRDEVKQDVYAVVAESGVTLDTRLLCQNVVVLALEVANDFAKASNRVSGVEVEWRK